MERCWILDAGCKKKRTEDWEGKGRGAEGWRGRQMIYKETWDQTEGTKVNLLGSSRRKAKGKKNDIEMGHK